MRLLLTVAVLILTLGVSRVLGRVLFIALLVLLSAGCAAEPYWAYGVEPPPPSYAGVQPAVPVFRHYVDDPDARCRELYGVPRTGGYTVYACAVLATDHCDIYLPIVALGDLRGQGRLAALDAHEVCHCKGLVHPHFGRGWATRDGREVTS